jgi:signal transduction histidine kinase
MKIRQSLVQNTQEIWKSIWKILGSPPLWFKIMGIALVPLILIFLVLFYSTRQDLLAFLADPSRNNLNEILSSTITQQVLLSLGITVVIGIPMALLLSRVLARPLHKMIQAIGQIENGDLSTRVDVWAEDEIGDVQVGLNELAIELERSQNALLQSNDALQVLNEVAETIAFGEALASVLEVALDQVMVLLHADAGAIYLLDDSNTTLQMKTVRGELASDLTEVAKQIQVHHSPMQRVIQSGEPLFLEDISQAQEHPTQISEILQREGYASWVCVPVSAQAQILGTICLSSRGNRTLQPGYLNFLQAIGNVIGIGIANRKLLDNLSLKEEQLRNALRRAVELQEEERKRIARELHDGVSQALTSILIRLRALDAEDDQETLLDRLEGLRYLTAETLEELRRLSLDLRPAALDNLGVVPALRWFSQRSSESSGIEIRFDGPDYLDRLPPEMEITLYRIAQEAILNAIRHAQASAINIRLERGTHSLWMTIEDNGQGFEMDKIKSGLGLIGIQERIALLDGEIKIDSSPDDGTKLWIELPLPESIRNDA